MDLLPVLFGEHRHRDDECSADVVEKPTRSFDDQGTPRIPMLKIVCRRKSRSYVHKGLSDLLGIEDSRIVEEFLHESAGCRLPGPVCAIEPDDHETTVLAFQRLSIPTLWRAPKDW